MTLLAALAAAICVPLSQDSRLLLFLSVGIFGGLAIPLYSICIAYTNDHLHPSQMIAASGALVLTGGLGAVLGPVLIASIMDQFGEQAFFWSMGGVHGLMGLYALYRMTRSAAVPREKQGHNTATAAHPTGSVIEGIQQLARDEATEFSIEDSDQE